MEIIEWKSAERFKPLMFTMNIISRNIYDIRIYVNTTLEYEYVIMISK